MNKMDSYNKFYDSICRLCLKFNKSNTMISLFAVSGKLNSFGKSVTAFSNIKLSEKDHLPSSMCKQCLILLKRCIYFKFTCENSEKELLKISSLSPQEYFEENLVEFALFKNNLCNAHFETKSKCEKKNNIQKSTKKQEYEMSNNMYIFFNGVKNETAISSMGERNKSDDSDESDVIENPEPSVNNKNLEYISTQRKRLKTLRKKIKYVKETLKAKKYTCKLCNKELANQNTYDNHMQKHNGYRFICEHCAKGFPVRVQLNMHLISQHGTAILPYLKCPQCPFKAPRKFDLIEHQRIHSGERPFTCDKCGLSFRRRAIWKKHLLQHMEKTVQCISCPKKFYHKGHMMSHYNSIHERAYMYACGECGALYAKPISVRRHLVDKHGIPREMQGKILRIKKGSEIQK